MLMKNKQFKLNNVFISYPKCWIKNKNTGEVKWFESPSGKAEDVAARYWAFFDIKDKMENLGSSFFDTKTYNYLDNAQIYEQQKEYLFQVSIKINKNTGVKEDPYNNIAFEYLCSIFLNTSFGNNSLKGSDLPGVIWGYGGGGVLAEKKIVKGFISKATVFQFFDAYMSSIDVGVGSDVTSNARAKAVNYFKERTKAYIDNQVLFRIKQHIF